MFVLQYIYIIKFEKLIVCLFCIHHRVIESKQVIQQKLYLKDV